ncbi:MAG: LLM class flavin-dependent oxidoreductase [Myxococcota bacterium]
MKLSVLDVLPVASGHSASDALDGAVTLARTVERAGYHRLWYAEHHGMANIASTSPELLIAHVGPSTERIRLGAGGVMLPNHVPLRVVEQYRTLEALHPGRVDLGIGRAAGTDPLTAQALRSAPGQHFGSMLAEVLAFDKSAFPGGHPFGRIDVTPAAVGLPPIWMLGSSGGSAELAGELGVGYAFAGHFSPMPPQPAIAAYRAAFRASIGFREPRVILAVHALCAPTSEEVEELALPVRYVLTQIAQGRSVPVPTPDEVRAMGFTAEDAGGPMADLLVAGTPDEVAEQLWGLADRTTADELMVMTLSHASAPRLASYELLARAAA